MKSSKITEVQIERVNLKITKLKKTLASDKKRCGGYYDDSRGVRYLIPEQYLKIQDYKGAARYFNWFNKTFPDDIGFPFFLFEWTVALFKTNKIKLAEKKAIETFVSNTYLFDKFLCKELISKGIEGGSNWKTIELANDFPYSKLSAELSDFTQWLTEFIASSKFCEFSNEFISIEIELNNESDTNKRFELIARINSLENKYLYPESYL